MLTSSIRQYAEKFAKGEVGAGLAEYILLLALIALVVMAAVGSIGDLIRVAFETAADSFQP